MGKRAEFGVFDENYTINDDTGVRDYIHVVELANGMLQHLKQLKID